MWSPGVQNFQETIIVSSARLGKGTCLAVSTRDGVWGQLESLRVFGQIFQVLFFSPIPGCTMPFVGLRHCAFGVSQIRDPALLTAYCGFQSHRDIWFSSTPSPSFPLHYFLSLSPRPCTFIPFQFCFPLMDFSVGLLREAETYQFSM